MSKRWLNHYLVTSGAWTEGQSDLVDTFMSIEFTPPTGVVFYETAHSGHVLVTRSGESSSSHGHGGGGKTTVHTGPTTIVIPDTQIYLNIVSGDGSARYLSAPLGVSIELSNVKTIELHIVFYVGPPGWKKSEYKAVVNAHLVFDSSPGGAKSPAKGMAKSAARSGKNRRRGGRPRA
jgi:hypothetical protein